MGPDTSTTALTANLYPCCGTGGADAGLTIGGKPMKHLPKQLAAYGLACALSLTALCGPATTLTASAHSGRTDANGGHHDYKNKSGLGSYHYHHGYPAHLHEGGICPYDAPQPAIPDPQPASPQILPAEPTPPDASIAMVEPETAPAAVINYALVFDASFYAAANPDVAALYGTDATLLFQHFLLSGMQEGRQGCASFHVLTYKESHPELAAVFGDDLTAYYTYYCTTNS